MSPTSDVGSMLAAGLGGARRVHRGPVDGRLAAPRPRFGLEWGVERSRDFRFAVIDEAFGRGSDISTRYALELFAKLGLQLLIVTPLQKVHVIEPYVRAIGFVDNPTGSGSRLQTLTVEEFRARRSGAATTASPAPRQP